MLTPFNIGTCPKPSGCFPEGKGLTPFNRGIFPKGKGLTPFNRGTFPKQKGLTPFNRGTCPKASGRCPEEKGRCPEAWGGKISRHRRICDPNGRERGIAITSNPNRVLNPVRVCAVTGVCRLYE
jgi:hypothetical protein